MAFHKSYQVNDKIHGFTINRIREIPHVEAVMHELTHDVTGASLVYVQTEDTNKLFSVAFKTIPADDTGVFHILEHSVLSGSEKYPLKEPFVELLKSSMNTFLNALTFPDKTLYPVSSRNDKDFHNLMGVYLDAVFAPKAMIDPNIFYQEGWHYELEEGQEVPAYKGVVFNEMKGAEASVDTVIRNYMKKMLYGDTCYGFNSGGAVDQIPTLTYEKYKEMYAKYYHPTNSVFFLEGNMNLEETLADIEDYLSRYDGPGPKFTIEYAQAQETNTQVGYYDRADAEDGDSNSHITYAKLWGTYKDVMEIAAIELLSDYLTGSNEAPLCKAVLGSGLAEDFSIGIQDGIKQPFFQIRVVNCKYEDRDALHNIIFDTMKALIEKGLGRRELRASLNEMEFQFREEQEPKALYRNIRVLDSAVYGGDPMLYLDADQIFDFLRDQMNSDYYEKLAEKLFDLDKMQILYMLPSAQVGAQKRETEEKTLREVSQKWTETDREAVLKLNAGLREWQQTPDTPEILAKIPRLSLSDVNPDPLPHKMEVRKHRGVTVLHHGEGTQGIVYLNLYFPIRYRDQQTLTDLSLLPSMFGILSTADRGPLEFQTDCQEHLGDLSYDIISETESGNMDSTRIYFEVSISALEKELPEALRLTREVLKTTRFEEDDLIQQKLMQKVEGTRRAIISSGNNFALTYTASTDTAEAAVEEALHGLTAYWQTKELSEHYQDKKEHFIQVMKQAQKEIFVIPSSEDSELGDPLETGVMFSITSNEELDKVIDLDAWIDAFVSDDVPGKKEKAEKTEKTEKTGELENEDPVLDIRRKDIPEKSAVVIPSGVSFAVSRANISKVDAKYGPKWRLLTNVLRFSYLWDEIRVQGGAYGTGVNANSLNEVGFYSFRDPDPIRSLSVYKKTGDFIRKYCAENDNLDSAIISTIAYMDPLLSAADVGDHYDSAYLRGVTYEKRKKFRYDMVDLKPEDLLECADVLDKTEECHRECVIGHADVVKKLEEQGFIVSHI